MRHSNLQQAAELRVKAMQFRAYAAQTHQPVYQVKLLSAANDLELEAGKLDQYRSFTLVHPRRAG